MLVDPKTVLCQYFAAGFCDKGAKVCSDLMLCMAAHLLTATTPAVALQCKFSHDKNIGRKTEKKNLYTDDREGGAADPNDKKNDTMDTWDDEKLQNVVLSKAGNPKTTTDVSNSPHSTLCLNRETDDIHLSFPLLA